MCRAMKSAGAPALTGRPRQCSTGQQVQVNVVNSLATVTIAIENEPEAVIGDTEVGGDLAGGQHQFAKHSRVPRDWHR